MNRMAPADLAAWGEVFLLVAGSGSAEHGVWGRVRPPLSMRYPGPACAAGRPLGGASAQERARRRYHDMEELAQPPELAQVLEGLLQRDRLDTERANSPLRAGDDAHIIDTDHIDLTQVVEHILALMEDD